MHLGSTAILKIISSAGKKVCYVLENSGNLWGVIAGKKGKAYNARK